MASSKVIASRSMNRSIEDVIGLNLISATCSSLETTTLLSIFSPKVRKCVTIMVSFAEKSVKDSLPHCEHLKLTLKHLDHRLLDVPLPHSSCAETPMSPLLLTCC